MPEARTRLNAAAGSQGATASVAWVLVEVVDEVDGQIGAADGGVAGGCVVHLLAQGGVGRDGESGDLQVPPGEAVDCLFGAPGRGQPKCIARLVGMGARVAGRVDAGGSDTNARSRAPARWVTSC